MLCALMTSLQADQTDNKTDEEYQVIVQEFVNKAQEYVKLNQIKEAIEIYERIVIAAPEDLELRSELATLYTRTHQHEKATHIWDELLNIEPKNIGYQDKLINSLQSVGRINDAFDIVQAYIKAKPEVGIHYAQLAKLYVHKDNVDAAIINYEKAIEFSYDSKDTFLNLAKLYFLNEDLDASEKALKSAILYASSEWDQQRIERQLINLYRYQGNTALMLQKIEDDDTISFELQKERARLLYTTGEMEMSASAFKKAIEMTTDIDLKNSVAEELIKVYIKQDRLDLAIAYFEAESSKHSRTKIHGISYSSNGINVRFYSDYPRNTLINAFVSQEKLDRLKTLFMDKLQKDADNPTFIDMLAEIYWNSYEFNNAAQTYLRLSEVEPKNIQSLYKAAAAFNRSNQPDMVKATLTQADNALTTSQFKQDASFLGALATICHDNVIYHHSIILGKNAIARLEGRGDNSLLTNQYEILAKSCLGAKRYNEAYLAYQQIAKVSRSSYTRRRAETEMMQIAKIGNLYEKWIPEQLKMVQENPNDTDLISKLAISYENTHRYNKAAEQYEKLTILQPDKSEWFKKLGNLYQNMQFEKKYIDEVIEGSALSLDGNRNHVEIGNSRSLNNITNQVTVSIWIKPTVFPNSYSTILFRGDEWDPGFKKRSYLLYLRYGGSIQFAASPTDTHDVSIYSPIASIKLNTWTHVAGVIDAKNNFMKLFIDGVEVSHSSFKGKTTIHQSRLPFRIGWTHEINQSVHSSFVGQIDDLRVWNIAQTVSDIRDGMFTELNGDENGLVGYWKFDRITEGKILDASPNKHDGKTIGNVKIEKCTRQIFEPLKNRQIDKAIAAYENAITLEPTRYELYDLLANSYTITGNTDNAEAVYRRALDAPLTQNDHDLAILAISALYSDEGQEYKRLALLEEIKPIMENSATLHELLGVQYKKIGDTEKSEHNYAKWLNLRQTALNSEQNAYIILDFAEELLDKELFPETALKYAKRAFQKFSRSDYDYPVTVGRGYIANELFDDALRYYKYALATESSVYASDNVWRQILEEGGKHKDNKHYKQMLDALINAIPHEESRYRANAHRMIAQFYSDKGMIKEAISYTLNGGFIPESRWITLGPFNNIDSKGHPHAYISEETTQIDPTAKYYGKNGLISWKKSEYRSLDGHYNILGDNDSSAAYFWAIVVSPDQRDVTIRFDSDDQGTIWLNGKKVFSHHRTSGVYLDRYTIPCTLNQGENTILLKVCNSMQAWGFYFRFTNADGMPFNDLKYKTADELLSATPPESTFHLNTILGMTEYYSKNNMHDKAMTQMQQTGFIHEYMWLTLGPFDNTGGIGYNTKYIHENTTDIDLTAEYEGKNEQIRWKKYTDTVFDAFIDFGRNIDWNVSYAWATIISPDAREVQFRFGSDDQSKIWVNGSKVFTNPSGRWAVIDEDIIPVKLNAGKNTILIKVCNQEKSWGFYLRVTDTDGKPFKDLIYNTVQDN